jgi:hypothetical protein
MIENLTIARRFNGPPNSGNGGYVAGLFARCIAQPVNVRLQKPIPLETPLSVRVQGERWEAIDGDEIIAVATPATREVPATPATPSYAQAMQCARDAPITGITGVFAHCFVCGGARAEGDGLRILCGHLADDMVAAPWTPHANLANADGEIGAEFVWAALDCPGMLAAFQDGRVALLGELAVELLQPVKASEPYVVVGWTIARAGRKRTAGTALLDNAGQCCAQGIATWIEISS